MGYVDLLRRPGAAGFVAAGFIGRLPISMISLGIVLLVTGNGQSWALAGAMSAALALAAAFIAPFGARWIDRSGQARTVPVLAGVQMVCLVAFTATASNNGPIPLQFALLVAAGGAAPNVGSLVRARWAALMSGSGDLRSAFALEAVVDEVVFIVGPPLVTTIALSATPQIALVVCVLLIAVGTSWLAVQRSTQPRTHEERGVHGPERMISAGLIMVTLILLLMGGIFGSFEVTTVAFTASLGHEESTGIMLALYALGSLISGVVMGAVTPSASQARQLAVFGMILAVVTIPLPFVQHIVPAMAAAFLAGMSVSPVLIVAATMVEHLVPASRLTEAFTVTTSGIAIGLAIGTTASGALIDASGPNSGYALMAACAVLAFLSALASLPILARSGLGRTGTRAA